MGPHSTHILLGLVAGATIYVGLLFARLRSLPDSARPFLALLSAGILIYLTIEVGYHAFESVESAFKLRHASAGLANLALVAAGLVLGLVVLGLWDDRNKTRKIGGVGPIELATMTAVGIGVHNFGEGLAIGQSYASGATALGLSLVVGFALHNATEGFGIVGALRGERIGWGKLGILGLIGGGPTVLGAGLGGFWTNALVVTFCYSLAAGSLLFVIRELLRIPFPISSRVALSAVACGLLIGLVTETVVETVQAAPGVGKAGVRTVELRILNGRFDPSSLEMPAGANLIIKNADGKVYTLEGPGILHGDVPVDSKGSQTVATNCDPGQYTIFAEGERMTLPVIVSGSAVVVQNSPDTVKLALAAGRQPVVFSELHEPAYGAYTSFNLTVKGEAARQRVLRDLFDIEKSLISDTPPQEIAQYFTKSGWARLRPSVSMFYGLGPTTFDGKRFGPRAASSKPPELHPIWYSGHLNFDAMKTQRDIVVRIASDSLTFDQQVCRYIWKQLLGRIAPDYTLDFGYNTQTGRSPLLGGFFDGTGNPIGKEREAAVYGNGEQTGGTGGTFLAWFKIRFDQERFESHTLEEQEKIIGRNKQSGLINKGRPQDAHQVRAEGDSTRTILRQGLVFDYGVKNTGLLFASAQSNLTGQFEGILCGFMLKVGKPTPGTGKDHLLNYMHFLEGGYYYIPPVPKNGYPGML